MAQTYTTVQGDLLDLICHRRYGRHVGTVELVLAANPGLAWQPPVLPAGVEIVLPDDPAQTPVATVKLW